MRLQTKFTLSMATLLMLASCGGGSKDAETAVVQSSEVTLEGTLSDKIVTFDSITSIEPSSVAPVDGGKILQFPAVVAAQTGAVVIFQGGAYELGDVVTSQGRSTINLKNANISHIFKSLKISGSENMSAQLNGQSVTENQGKVSPQTVGIGNNAVEFGIEKFKGKIYSVGDSFFHVNPEIIYRNIENEPEVNGFGFTMDFRHSFAWEVEGDVTATVNFVRPVGPDRCLPIKNIKLLGPAMVVSAVSAIINAELCIGLQYGFELEKPDKPLSFKVSGLANPTVLAFSSTAAVYSDRSPKIAFSSTGTSVSTSDKFEMRPIDSGVFENCRAFTLEPRVFAQLTPSVKIFNNIAIASAPVSANVKPKFEVMKDSAGEARYGTAGQFFLGSQIELGAVPFKVLGVTLNVGLYKSELFELYTISSFDVRPLPRCFSVAPPAVSGNAVVAVAKAHPPGNGTGTVTSPNPNVKVDPNGIITFPGPGEYDIKYVTKTSEGVPEETTTKVNVVPSGTYTGTWTGTDAGDFNITIDSRGVISGGGRASNGDTKTASGTMGTEGNVQFLAGSTAGGATFSGTVVPRNGKWHIGGTWVNSRSGYSGSFEGLSN